MDLLLSTTILGGILLGILYYLIYKCVNYWEDRNFPNVTGGVPSFFDDLKKVIFPQQTQDQVITSFYKKTKAYKYCGINVLFLRKIFLNDPEIITNVMVKDFAYFCNRPIPVDEEREPLSGNLFGLKGDTWRGTRYKLAPTFTSGKLKSMIPQVTHYSDEIIACIEEKNQPLNVKEVVDCFTFNVIGSVAFGMKVDAHKSKDGEKNQFLENARSFFQISLSKFVSIVTIQLYPRIAKLLNLTFIDKDVSDFYIKIIKDTVKYRKDTGTKRNDFLQLMMNIQEKDEESNEKQTSAKKDLHEEQHDENDKELLQNIDNFKHNSPQLKLSDISLAAHSFIFIVGGSETTSNVITFTLYELAENPGIQEKLQDEIDSVLADQEINYQTINSIPYLDRVVHETLRKHPPIATLDRECVQDYKIPGTEHVIKKGEELIVPVVGLHYDPDFFPDPETFDPDRFLDPNTIKKGTYLPFGQGPRFCIAMRFALMEVKIFLAKTLRTYNVKLSPKTTLPLTFKKRTFVRVVEGGLWVEFHRRTEQNV